VLARWHRALIERRHAEALEPAAEAVTVSVRIAQAMRDDAADRGARFLLILLPTERDLVDAGRVIESQRFSTPYLVYLGDKAILWNETRTAFLMYGICGRTWVALGDPVGPTREAGPLVRRFLEMVEDADGIPVFYQVQKDSLHRYADFGLAFAKAGEEALVPLQTFSLDGGSRKKMRLFWHKFEKDGATFRNVTACDVPSILPA
jgi:phosphatidylglycerol lysyltransferase